MEDSTNTENEKTLYETINEVSPPFFKEDDVELDEAAKYGAPSTMTNPGSRSATFKKGIEVFGAKEPSLIHVEKLYLKRDKLQHQLNQINKEISQREDALRKSLARKPGTSRLSGGLRKDRRHLTRPAG